ncbi:MAG: hypothetical protein ACRETP_02490, partial [Steroidobacteraceae bacterium]
VKPDALEVHSDPTRPGWPWVKEQQMQLPSEEIETLEFGPSSHQESERGQRFAAVGASLL